MRIAVGALGLVLLVGAQAAQAAEFSSCWVTTVRSPITLVERQVTRCRIAGGSVINFASDDSVPGRLYPAPGTDLNGACWYYSSVDRNWVFGSLYGNGDALLGYVAGVGGGYAVVTGRIPRCTSEPAPLAEPVADVWSYVTDYIHPPPAPELNPELGDGVTGLDTYLAVPIPDVHTAQLNSGGSILDVYIEVSAVIVDWGDGSTDTYPANGQALSGYPDGIAIHVYEIKDEDGFSVSVAYDWTARWRSTGQPWQSIAVPNTSSSVTYPVAEIISVITD